MTLTLRIILIVVSIFAFIYCIKKIKQSKLKIAESIIWMIGSLVLIVMSIFPDAVAWLATKLGIIAPVNFVFLTLIGFLLLETFICNIKISNLNEKIKNLNHYIALKEYDKKSKEE